MSSEIKQIEANGLQFAYLEAGRGPLVLLLHGFPDTAESWAPTLKALAAAGYRAVAPFLRGYYPSGIPADGDYSTLALANDALALIEALGEKSAIVVGHDWGAFAAYVAAILAPGKVRKLVTLAIPHPRVIVPTPKTFIKAPHFVFLSLGSFGEWYARRNNLAYVDYLYRYWSPNWQAPQAEVERVKEDFRRPDRLYAVLGYYRWLARDALNPKRQELYRRQISVPTLALAGECDGALDVSLYAKMPSAFTGPYEGVIFPRLGHFLHREDPDKFMRTLLQFLSLS